VKALGEIARFYLCISVKLTFEVAVVVALVAVTVIV